MQTKLICISALLISFCVSCIQDEPLNPEADILTFTMPENVALMDASFNVNSITVYVRKNVDLSAITPTIQITEGATISPDPSTPQNFSQPVVYTVTSESGESQRTYTVQTISSTIYNYYFENWKQLSSAYTYLTPVEFDGEGNQYTPWDSSSRGIVFYKQYPTADGYPVHPTTDAFQGTYAAEMVTQEGPGSILGVMYIPIIAGSLFLGELNPINALIDPLLATQFGQPFTDKPLRMRGSYKYKAGTANYVNPDGSTSTSVKDSCAVYSVFYKIDDNLQTLDGTNVRNHPNIVAMAMMPDENRAGSEGDDFVHFDIAFEYKEGAVVDFENNNYKLAIVLSSSFYGDRYEGSPGSRLVVDAVEIITED